MFAEDCARIIPVDVCAHKLNAPLKRTHNPVIVTLCMRDLTGAHPSSEQIASPAVFEESKRSSNFPISHPRVSELLNQGRMDGQNNVVR
jgi:hypothetical protein